MDEQGNFLIGLMWGTSLSIPLWLEHSLVGEG